MDKKVILAVAGSGKTYHICNNINKEARNVIIAFTNQNIKNIVVELIKKFGYVPEKTLVMTFHSFIYNFMIRPFDNFIGSFYGKNAFSSNGVSILPPPLPSIKVGDNLYKKNKDYSAVNSLEHFIDKNDRYYSDYLSKLILKVKDKNNSLLKEACKNVNKFFDCILVDEMQDFREENWELLTKIIENVNNITLVGDYNQHSVSGLNNHGTPFSKNNSYEEYKSYLSSIGLIVDETSLIKSRRCSEEVCNFIKERLAINIESTKLNDGHIIWLDNADRQKIEQVLRNDKIVKLVLEKPEIYNFNAISWSYSKGDTYEETCVILTDKYSKLNENDFSLPSSVISVNKLYVALTRSKGNVYIIKKDTFNSIYKT